MDYAFYRKIESGWKFADYGELSLESLTEYIDFHKHIEDSNTEYLVLKRSLNVPFTMDINTSVKRFQIEGFYSVKIILPNSLLPFTIVASYEDISNFRDSIGAK